jgi:hypothetical protein
MAGRLSALRAGRPLPPRIFQGCPEEVIGFFNLPNPSSRTMVLGSTQPLTEMSTRNVLLKYFQYTVSVIIIFHYNMYIYTHFFLYLLFSLFITILFRACKSIIIISIIT